MSQNVTPLQIRQQLANDPHRPAYHFQPPKNWMNDPNGFIHWKGQYHLFYQHNPSSPLHGRIHWGHAVSDDLVHWRDLPIALSPTPDGPDKDGCWSGCAIDNDGVPTLVYTGVHPEVQCIAIGSGDMLRWQKHAANPVIAAPPDALEVTGFRDPHLWREGPDWYAIIGSGIRDVGGAVLLYRSADLVNWEYLHPLCLGDKNETGVMWECPSFFPLGDRYVLFVSVTPLAYVEYFVGTYKEHKFEPEYHARLDHSGLFYAPQSIFDATGRRLMFGWLRESRGNEAIEAAGWSGMQSVPRVLTMNAHGKLGINPAPELQRLRGERCSLSSVLVKPDTDHMLPNVQGDALEIFAEFVPGSARVSGLKLRCSPGEEEVTKIVYNWETQMLAIDRSRSCAQPDGVDCSPQLGAVRLSEDETLRLRVFLDRSAVEVFANDHECISSRIYPTRRDSNAVGLFTEGGDAIVRQLDVWAMAPIWPL